MSDHMLRSAEHRLGDLGLVLPPAAAPVANYIAVAKMGGLLVVSGQLPFGPDGKIDPRHVGKLGAGVSAEDGRAAARACALNVLAQVRAHLGSLDPVGRCLRLGGFINCASDFKELAQVMNGASDLIVEVFGDRGRHARSTIGVAQLPLDAAVEVEAMFEAAL
ncbi:MAG: RidA family protein [Methylobacteriaceae bacterium]|nr:RidA family protein [Methylobacteriaceae bacterium]HPG03911.1 RidA family protein [Rhodoblastus sp.]